MNLIDDLNAAFMSNLSVFLIIITVLIMAMIGIIIKLTLDLNKMEKRYRKMTAGADEVDLQQILIEHAKNIDVVVEENRKISDEINLMKSLAKRAITRVAVVRFNAFHEDSGELSYSIAMLDDENSGVIISSLNGRDFTRNYVKPVVKGESQSYKLTKEEQRALNDAAIPPEQRDADKIAED